MSEFSDCYFLRAGEGADAGALLKRARRFGFILADSGDWTPFLVDGLRDAGGVAPDVAEQNRDVMLHYAYAEDQGLTLAIYRGPERVVSIDVQRRGPSELETDAIVEAVRSLGFGDASALRALLEDARRDTVLNMGEARARMGSALGVAFPVSISCADLSRSSLSELQRRFPGGRAVLKSRRGKSDHRQQPSPNEWCPVAGLPDFMYLPLPSGAVEAGELERHVHHWLSTGDFDAERARLLAPHRVPPRAAIALRISRRPDHEPVTGLSRSVRGGASSNPAGGLGRCGGRVRLGAVPGPEGRGAATLEA